MSGLSIAVAGTGYADLSIAALSAQHNPATAMEIMPEKAEKINKKIPLIRMNI
ncbi:MAG: UDP-glucose 6-dehydrogenase [Clostridiales bacterium]|nr:UDP-glucose 6-dehydrogenase [Clostridiales bacterium]